MVLGVATYAQRGAGGGAPVEPGQAPAGGRGGGRGPSPEQQAAAAAQAAAEAAAPQIPFDAVSLPLMPTGHTIGETEGVALNSKRHLFVYTRSGNLGPARGATAAELFEFDEKGNYVKEWGQNAYGFSFAHAVRVDKDDNIWVVDEGSNMVIKFNPAGRVVMTIGRRPEAVDELTNMSGQGSAPNSNKPYSFNRPTDV